AAGGRAGGGRGGDAGSVAAWWTRACGRWVLLGSSASGVGPPQRVANPPAAEQPAAGEPASPRPLKVLLADDNPVNQMTATTMLQKLGHAVVVANNGREVLDKVHGDSFDLVFMDVQMPEMDGLEAAAEIRKREKASGKHLPI